jgi:hypothetical protein
VVDHIILSDGKTCTGEFTEFSYISQSADEYIQHQRVRNLCQRPRHLPYLLFWPICPPDTCPTITFSSTDPAFPFTQTARPARDTALTNARLVHPTFLCSRVTAAASPPAPRPSTRRLVGHVEIVRFVLQVVFYWWLGQMPSCASHGVVLRVLPWTVGLAPAPLAGLESVYRVGLCAHQR